MIPMTTHHLGQRPGRARLGAYGRGTQGGTGTTCTRTRGAVAVVEAGTADWRTPARPVFDASSCGTLATSGNAHAMGRMLIKRTARLLGTRST